MLNLQVCTVIIMTKKIKKKKIKKSRGFRDSNPGHMGSKSTYTSTTPRRTVRVVGKNNQYMLKL